MVFGEGKASEYAAYIMALHGEASDSDQGGLIAAPIGDLLKGFEKVGHIKLVEAAAKHKYPMLLLRLALDMYRGARHIQWNQTASNKAYTGVGVVAGCGLAMHLLGLLLLDPIDKYLATKPKHLVLFQMYVDDFMRLFKAEGGNDYQKRIAFARYVAREINFLCRRFNIDSGLVVAPTKGKFFYISH